jgi:phenylalanyl-tRNA synthetase beta chain
MKFTMSWLKTHLDTDAGLEEICEKLTAIGLEIESVEDRAKTYAPFTLAYVESAEKHPDADKLQVCQVKTVDQGVQTIVCGAPNARAGLKVIFAPNGSYIPGLDVTLKKTAIRGVESNGMMVSEKEMCLSDEHNGIIEVDDKYDLGTPMAEIYGLDDPIIEINLTPNRADCAGVYGVARDLAAAGLGALKPLAIESDQGNFKSTVGVKIENAEGCPHFVGRMIKGIKNGPSPEWLQQNLKAIGLRPISALVDITNLMTHDHARPLHAYDADKLSGDIVVGTSKGGEELEALNDKSYELVADAVTINDQNGVIGLGGIVGGTSTGVSAETTNVFLEAAYFTPQRIARTGRDQGVQSDARYRFERGVDPEFTRPSMDLFTSLVLAICGDDSSEVSEIVEAGAPPSWARAIDYDPAYTKALIGIDVDADEQMRILNALGFKVDNSNTPWSITPPSWRGDVFGKADITEEIARIYGFEKIPSVSVNHDEIMPVCAETPLLANIRKSRAALSARGLDECLTWSFVGEQQARSFGDNDNQVAALRLQNPISSEMDVMRPAIFPTLIDAAIRNEARGYPNAALCEVGPIFEGTAPDEQRIVASGIRTGAMAGKHWADENAARGVDLYDAKADALAALEACGAPAANAQIKRGAANYYHPGRSGMLSLGKNVIAQFGEIHPAILEEMGVKFPVVGFEIFLENLPQSKKKGTEKPMLKVEPLQPLSRDFAFLVDMDVAAQDVVRAATAADKKLIVGGEIFDIYTGKGVDEGQKSVALNITIQPKGESLTDKDLEGLAAKVIDNVAGKVGGALRG